MRYCIVHYLYTLDDGNAFKAKGLNQERNPNRFLMLERFQIPTKGYVK